MLHVLIGLADAAEPAPLASICSWDDAPWQRSADLLLVGTDRRIVSIRSARDPVGLTGALGVDRLGRVRLRARLVGADVSVWGDPRREITGRRPLSVRAEPDGPVAGVFRRSEHPRRVYLVEASDGRARVAAPRWTGVVWQGWVDEDRLTEATDPGVTDLLTGSFVGDGDEVFVRCPTALELLVPVGRDVVPIGEIAASTLLGVEGERGAHVAVSLPESWLGPADGGELWVTAEAAACPQAPYRGRSLEDVLQGLGD